MQYSGEEVRTKSHTKWGKGVPGSGNSTCKGPGVGQCLVSLRTKEKTGEIGLGRNSWMITKRCGAAALAKIRSTAYAKEWSSPRAADGQNGGN